MNIGLIIRTVRHLKMTQMVHQILYRLHKPKYVVMEAPLVGERPAGFKTEPIARWKCWEQEQSQFCFLNISAPFTTWNETSHGMLWAYNQNYMDWLNQKGGLVNSEEGAFWIDKFIEDVLHTENKSHTDIRSALPLATAGTQDCNTEITNYKNNSYQVGLDPYPIALRSINWIKFFIQYPETATKERRDALYSQLRLLEKKLEYHLLANHLLEDAYALYIGAAYFGDKRLLKKAKKLLLGQLEEQILPDGGHYEQSVMYHCILLDRLLDCINISTTRSSSARLLPTGRKNYTNFTNSLSAFAVKMLGHLESIVWEDGSIPMVNDAAYGIAPTPDQIFGYAYRLGLKWEAIPLKECGYRKMKNDYMEAFVDVGNITATYQPGHAHADTFNFELRIDGKPFVVDTGVSTYNKNAQRQQERSTSSHNTVVVNNQNSSEVWGGFRIGKRAKVTFLKDTPKYVKAWHDGYGKNGHQRTFNMDDSAFTIEDETLGKGVGYLHFAPNVAVKECNSERIITNTVVIELKNVEKVDLEDSEVSVEYHKMRKTTKAKLYFDRKMEYKFLKR